MSFVYIIDDGCVCTTAEWNSQDRDRVIAHQTPLSLAFSRQEYWSELPFPSPGDLPDPRIEPASIALQLDSLPSEPAGRPCNV